MAIRAVAKNRMPHFLFEYLDGGSYDEVTLRRNGEDLRGGALRRRGATFRRWTPTDLFGQSLVAAMVGPVARMPGMYGRRGEIKERPARHWRQRALRLVDAQHLLGPRDGGELAAGPFWLQLYMIGDRGFLTRILAIGRQARLLRIASDRRSAGVG